MRGLPLQFYKNAQQCLLANTCLANSKERCEGEDLAKAAVLILVHLGAASWINLICSLLLSLLLYPALPKAYGATVGPVEEASLREAATQREHANCSPSGTWSILGRA